MQAFGTGMTAAHEVHILLGYHTHHYHAPRCNHPEALCHCLVSNGTLAERCVWGTVMSRIKMASWDK